MDDVKTRKPKKIDLAALVGPLDQKEEPKTLEECLHEAGGFPFVARAVVDVSPGPTDTCSPFPVGTELTFVRIADKGPFTGHMVTLELGIRWVVDRGPRRWTLVGHRT